MAGFCTPWILAFGEIVRPLVQATAKEAKDPVHWSKDKEQAFHQIKHALMTAPALGLPDYTKPFILHVHENRSGFWSTDTTLGRSASTSRILLSSTGPGRPRSCFVPWLCHCRCNAGTASPRSGLGPPTYHKSATFSRGYPPPA